jgi:L-serine/L-threonine ammonia-lyase
MAHLCTTVQKMHNSASNGKMTSKIKVISSSGGNAGLAVTTVARNMPQMDVSVVVPETTKPIVVEKLRSLGAEVTIHGKNWNAADELARKWVDDAKKSGEGAFYISPYDNPLLWTGHSTVIDEIITQLLEQNRESGQKKIGAVIASVGGGGLLCGILEGIERNYHSLNEIRSKMVRGSKVVACETDGAASFAASFNSSDGSIIRLDSINSIASSLGALQVTPAVIQRCRRHRDRGEISSSGEDVISYVCTDEEAVQGCVQFSSDHRMLVEPACGASLAPLYSDRLRTKLLDKLKDDESSVIVVEVCGGSGVDLDLLIEWKETFKDKK